MSIIAFYQQQGIALVEQGHGVAFGWIEGEPPIHIFVLPSMGRQAVDAWAQAMIEPVEACMAGAFSPWLALHDFSQVSVASSLTPYIRRVFEDFSRRAPMLEGKVAFLTAKNPVVSRIGDPVIRRYVGTVQPQITPRLFFEHASAIAWLRERDSAG